MRSNTKTIIRLALLAAISIVLGKYLQIAIGDSIRISFENLSIIFAGFVYGPFAGLLCGVVADIVGCLMVGYSLNPIITLGAAVIGFSSGVFGRRGFLKKPNLLLSAATAHILGSMIIKTVGLYVYFATQPLFLLLRVPLYVAVGALEYMLIRFCLNHRGLGALL